jgi:uncharacterized glyoxalase superfamily protein PhnB
MGSIKTQLHSFKHMKFKELTPMMETNDMDATITFYTSVLGFTSGDTLAHEGKTVWCTLWKDELSIMFCLPNKVMNYGRILLSGSLYIYIDGVDEYWQQVKDKVTVVYGPENFPYQMREFGIKDNNGYVLNFGQSLI